MRPARCPHISTRSGCGPPVTPASPVVSDPIRNGLLRTANWLGFHAILIVAAGGLLVARAAMEVRRLGRALLRRSGARMAFLPALFLPAAARAGHPRGSRRAESLAFAAILLAIPLIRFAPRYISLDHWSDLALDEDSRAASKIALRRASRLHPLCLGLPSRDLRLHRLKPATKYLECQALTGVPADRHLTQSGVVLTEGTHEPARNWSAPCRTF